MDALYSDISRTIQAWYKQHKRILPWRGSQDPYLVWLSEVILQQTRVEQGTPYFLKFREVFPTVAHLANADSDHVMKLWQGLGYYSRARNLHNAAKQVLADFGGVFPSSYEGLLKLKGVGPYTAAAIASIAFDQPKAVVDGNVARVVSRLFGIAEPVNETATAQRIQQIADRLLHGAPGEHNQGMMEFGAIFCVPRNPSCETCPVTSLCLARQKGLVGQIPLKTKKLKRKTRHLHYIVATYGDMVPVRKRDTTDIWAGLFEFPLLEKADSQWLSPSEIEQVLKTEGIEVRRINPVKKHVLTHQDIVATFYHVLSAKPGPEGFELVKTSEVHTFALPRLIDRYLERHELTSGNEY